MLAKALEINTSIGDLSDLIITTTTILQVTFNFQSILSTSKPSFHASYSTSKGMFALNTHKKHIYTHALASCWCWRCAVLAPWEQIWCRHITIYEPVTPSISLNITSALSASSCSASHRQSRTVVETVPQCGESTLQNTPLFAIIIVPTHQPTHIRAWRMVIPVSRSAFRS